MSLTKVNKDQSLIPSVLSDFLDTERFFGNHFLEGEFEKMLPAVNILERKNDYAIEFAAPGFRKEEFKVEVDEGILSVTAEREEEKSQDEERFTRKEFSYNSFKRSFTLPQNINTDKIEAHYTNGILKLEIAKKNGAPANAARAIKVL